jgi:hypothetical protein
MDVVYLIYFRCIVYTVCNLNYTPTTFWGYKVEENLHLGVREQKKEVEYHWPVT